MAVTYTDFVANVRAWSNRDEDVLPDAIIYDAMHYAMDKAYKMLEIPALEATVDYTIIDDGDLPADSYDVYLNENSNGIKSVNLPIPADLTSFIHLRIKSSGSAGREGVVFNEKTDIRTYHDMYADRYTDFFWSRQGGYVKATGAMSVGDVIELFYYRRLPALDARYSITASNFNNYLILVPATEATSGTTLYFDNGTVYPPVPGTDTAYDTQNGGGTREAFLFADSSGLELDHWFRDENQQVVLFGALHQCFDYLDDDAASNKYRAKFMEAVMELNEEEKRRKASGGNIQIHFNSQLI